MSLAPVYDLSSRRSSVDALVAEHTEWARSIARRLYGGAWAWSADAESAAMEALWRAARAWAGAGDFRAFAYCRLRSAAVDAVRSASRARTATACACGGTDTDCERCQGTGHMRRVLPLSLDVGLGAGLGASIPAPEPDEQAAALDDLVAQLTGRELEVVVRYLDGETLTAIAESWGVTDSRACQVMSAAKTTLRRLAVARGLVEVA